MEAMIALGLVMVVGFGGMMLALVTGYLSTEKARALDQAQRQGHVARSVRAIPSFFVMSERGELVGPTELDEMLLTRLESHVREEQAIVNEFVHYPSIHSLYRPAPQALRMH